MQTRRELLQQCLVLPLTLAAPCNSGLEILCEQDCLSQESARGFSLAQVRHNHSLAVVARKTLSNFQQLTEPRPRGSGFNPRYDELGLAPAAKRRMVIVCGAGSRALARGPELLNRAERGEWIIWESSFRKEIHDLFGIGLGAPFSAGLYIQYSWPCRVMTRSFLQPVPVLCSEAEVIALHGQTPVAMKRRIGRGGIVFLGSMLGPNLHAEEPEAHRITKALFRSLRSG